MGEQQCKIFETATTGKADPLIPAERVLMPYSVGQPKSEAGGVPAVGGGHKSRADSRDQGGNGEDN
jgi:hypothetical protein